MTQTQPEIQKITLSNKDSMSVDLTNFGATIMSINVPDKHGTLGDVVVGYNQPEDYRDKDNPSMGVPGRYAGRIEGGSFQLEGATYTLDQNNGRHCLHGGNNSLYKTTWNIEAVSPQSVTFGCISPEGDGGNGIDRTGFPGNLDVRVTYTLTDNNAIKIHYEAQTDKPTVLNLTNHTYFNLAGEASGRNVTDLMLTMPAKEYLAVDAEMLPQEIVPVAGTPFDFTTPKPLSHALAHTDDPQINIAGGGIDHTFLIPDYDGTTLRLAAHAEDRESGRSMDVYTTELSMQVYTPNSLSTIPTKDGSKQHGQHDAICFETQHLPDSPNHPEYPTTILNPGERYTSETIYQFSVQAQR
ncbi:MAG: galactose mutarotase [Alphaproteobacteria bacterium]|nr:MAG: galactose mutarotase [Alphaproteobacteria bacterium]